MCDHLQGPQGVANFSQCTYFNMSNDAVASDINASYTPWVPSLTSLEVGTYL